MENRSHALVAGLFTVLLLAAAVFTVFWLKSDHAQLIPYDLVTVDSVQGLAPEADVRYRGLPVGKVEAIHFDPELTGAILVRIGVREGTPMTDTLKATVAMKGITGVAYVDLDDDGKPGKPIHSSPGHVARIMMQPGLSERVMNRAAELMDGIEQVVVELQKLLGPTNQQAFTTTLENLAQFSALANQTLTELQPTIERLDPLLTALARASNDAGVAAREFSGLAQDVRRGIQVLTNPGGLVDQTTQTVTEIRRATSTFTDLAPQVSTTITDIGQAASAATRALRAVERAPQAVMFGSPQPRPGPGEPGFAGFGTSGNGAGTPNAGSGGGTRTRGSEPIATWQRRDPR